MIANAVDDWLCAELLPFIAREFLTLAATYPMVTLGSIHNRRNFYSSYAQNQKNRCGIHPETMGTPRKTGRIWMHILRWESVS